MPALRNVDEPEQIDAIMADAGDTVLEMLVSDDEAAIPAPQTERPVEAPPSPGDPMPLALPLHTPPALPAASDGEGPLLLLADSNEEVGAQALLISMV